MNNNIKEVFIVFKTHLDIGFGDLGDAVVKSYLEHFIPSAIKRGYELKDTDTPFIWSVGSWLINEALKRDDDGSVAKAIKDGIIKWHALPFTPFVEAMNADLFEYGLSLSKTLDARFSKKTIAAKTSDVPGHTVAMVPYLVKSGIELLHIGTNGVYPPTKKLPEIFRWKNGEDELTVIYQRRYGNTLEIGETVVTWGFTGDNQGPQSVEQIQALYAGLREQYPNADIRAATLDDVALALRVYKNELPVFENEIGDLWIQNVGTDPKKVGIYRDLLRHIEQNGIQADISDSLLLVPEHTWGGDTKTFYPDYSRYTVAEMQATENDPKRKRFEESWQEKREYLNKAQRVMNVSYPYEVEIPDLSGFDECEIPDPFFEISWQLFDIDDYRRFFDKVVARDYRSQWWVVLDNYKYNMPKYKGGVYAATPKKAYKKRETTVIYLEFNAELTQAHGLPYIYAVVCGEQLEIRTFGQKANRLPNAFWVKFKGQTEENWQIRKLGQWIDARGVLSAPLLHATDKGVRNDRVEIDCMDSMLVAPYGRRLLDNEDDPQKQDMYFNLYNNVWGCNHPMWYGDDSRFRFIIRARSK